VVCQLDFDQRRLVLKIPKSGFAASNSACRPLNSSATPVASKLLSNLSTRSDRSRISAQALRTGASATISSSGSRSSYALNAATSAIFLTSDSKG